MTSLTCAAVVSQVLCTCLWLMDEYWNYALFNVFSICMFEASTAFGRLKNLSTLRSMRNKEITVQVRLRDSHVMCGQLSVGNMMFAHPSVAMFSTGDVPRSHRARPCRQKSARRHSIPSPPWCLYGAV